MPHIENVLWCLKYYVICLYSTCCIRLPISIHKIVIENFFLRDCQIVNLSVEFQMHFFWNSFVGFLQQFDDSFILKERKKRERAKKNVSKLNDMLVFLALTNQSIENPFNEM